jgi:hypothetical protein
MNHGRGLPVRVCVKVFIRADMLSPPLRSNDCSFDFALGRSALSGR